MPRQEPEHHKSSNLFELLFDFVLGNDVAFVVESADNVFITLEREVGLFTLGSGQFHGHRTVGVLHSGDRVAFGILFEVGVARSERVGTGPEFDSVEHEAVHEEQADAVHREPHQEEVDDGVQPLVTKSAVPVVKLVEASILAIAAGKNDHAGAEKGDNTFFHF